MTNHDTGKVDAKKARIIVGDCLEVLKGFESDSIDSLVTDPPAGIGFMGQEWDHHKGGRAEWVAWMTGVMRECHRVMKPGAHGLVWAIPRTSHWTATALEDAGFEVRDVVTHLFGQGFPKSLDISKAIDKAAGAEREVVGTRELTGKARVLKGGNFDGDYEGKEVTAEYAITAPATEAAKLWQGWGTALKPACEFWILVRKPISEKNVAANVLKHGVGGLNIDGCRIEAADQSALDAAVKRMTGNLSKTWVLCGSPTIQPKSAKGRFPANLVLSHSPHCTDDQCDIECAIAMLDEQSLAGGMHSAGRARSAKRECEPTGMWKHAGDGHRLGDSGGASRFFYCAKISPGERNAGLEGMPERRGGGMSGTLDGTLDGTLKTGSGNERNSLMKNHHPTVKPQKLMRYLCKLVTPPGGLVLDPFAGSFSTGVAALAEGFGFIGIEKEADYIEIGKRRLAHAHASYGNAGTNKSNCSDDLHNAHSDSLEKAGHDEQK